MLINQEAIWVNSRKKSEIFRNNQEKKTKSLFITKPRAIPKFPISQNYLSEDSLYKNHTIIEGVDIIGVFFSRQGQKPPVILFSWREDRCM